VTAPPGAILVCGCQRSGTTLLTALLDGHSRILVFPEETFFFEGCRLHRDRTVAEWVDALLAAPACRNVGKHFYSPAPHEGPAHAAFDAVTFARRFRELALAAGEVAQVLPALAAAYGLACGQGPRRYWAEKTPGNESSLFRAASWYRDLRPVYILRDPRAVLCSLALKQRKETGRPVEVHVPDFLFTWAQSLFAWERFVAHGGRGLLLRYEDLVRDPRAGMERVCAFLDVPYEDALTRPWRGGVPFSGNSSFGGHTDGVSTDSLDRWRDVLRAEDVAAIELWLGHVMLRRGYALTGPRTRGWRSAEGALLRNPCWRPLLGLLLGLSEPGSLLPHVGDRLLRPLYEESGDMVRRPEERSRDERKPRPRGVEP